MFKRIDVLAIAILIALIYLGTIICLQLEYGLSAWAEDQHLNILGDSIGGITAPLALIFLIAAVIIQRQELALTKAELAESAKALKSQVVEQRQHREFVGQQTELMRKEAEASAENTRKAYKLSLFDKRYAVYSQIRELRDAIQQENLGWDHLEAKISDLNNQAHFLFQDDVNHWFAHIYDDVQRCGARFNEVHELRIVEYDQYGNSVNRPDEQYEQAREIYEGQRDLLLIQLSDPVLYKVFAEPMEVTD